MGVEEDQGGLVRLGCAEVSRRCDPHVLATEHPYSLASEDLCRQGVCAPVVAAIVDDHDLAGNVVGAEHRFDGFAQSIAFIEDRDDDGSGRLSHPGGR